MASRPGLVLLDRDGVLNELWCDQGSGLADSPRSAEEVVLRPGAAQAVRRLNELRIPCVIVSNQPGIAKGKMTCESLRDVTRAVVYQLGRAHAAVDRVYYCLHHPDAVVGELRTRCWNRKPAEGMLLRAMRDFATSPAATWMIGDTSNDLLAGRAASCSTGWVRGSGAEEPPTSLIADADAVGSNLLEIIAAIFD